MQYFTKLPSGLVEVHLVGATIIAGATAWLCLSLRERGADEAGGQHAADLSAAPAVRPG